ncbi:winged helix-turn-helix transcriptional regulator [Bradyrhizobium sp. RDI18]|uniref:winged helix-turn-helix transcriptional regulator n=1 Tax=Bradyrhizobium sp. RDI18 TaxID=3367400 RepID=UPI003717DC21
MSSAALRLELDNPQPRRPADCPVEDWLAFLGHRWNALVLWHLKDGPKRHGELAELLPGVSPKVLSERLDGLEDRGLVLRSPTTAFPRRVTYSLSLKGTELLSILDRLELWSRRDDRAAARSHDHAS